MDSKQKQDELIKEAQKWIGIQEAGGPNKGKEVEMFQKAVDGKANGESWCMSFVQFCLSQVDKLETSPTGKHFISKTEHCMTAWNKTPKECRIDKPEVGSVVIWQYWKDGASTASGHTGIVIGLNKDGSFNTIEGNTSGDPNLNVVDREGDGVFKKKRLLNKSLGNMRVIGFLKPWLKPEEQICAVPIAKPKKDKK